MFNEQKVTLQALWDRKSTLPVQSKGNIFFELLSGVRGRWFHTKGIFIFSSIALSLLFFIGGFFLLLSSVAKNIASTLPTQISLHIVLEDGITRDQTEVIEGRLRNFEYQLYDKSEALKKVSDKLSLPKEAIEFLSSDNPLPAYFQVFASSEDDLLKVKQDLKSIDGIKKIELDESILTFFGSISQKASMIALLIIFSVILSEAVFLSLVIMLLCYMYREEVLIQKFFGGQDSRVISPFLLDGVLLGVLCSLIGSTAVSILFSLYGNNLQVQSLSVTWIFTLNILIGIFVGAVSSYMAAKIFLSSHRGSV